MEVIDAPRRRDPWRIVLVALLVGVLAACASSRGPEGVPAAPGEATPGPAAPEPTSREGGYYSNDGPPASVQVDLDAIPDAEPRFEPMHPRANRPYTVFGQMYEPMRARVAYRERGHASWYGRKFHGLKTSSGEVYDMFAMTAAHPTLPIPSYVRVTNLENDRTVVVRVNDRGPFLRGRLIDLSYAAAHRLGYVAQGSAPVEVEVIGPGHPLMNASVGSAVAASASASASPLASRQPPGVRPAGSGGSAGSSASATAGSGSGSGSGADSGAGPGARREVLASASSTGETWRNQATGRDTADGGVAQRGVAQREVAQREVAQLEVAQREVAQRDAPGRAQAEREPPGRDSAVRAAPIVVGTVRVAETRQVDSPASALIVETLPPPALASPPVPATSPAIVSAPAPAPVATPAAAPAPAFPASAPSAVTAAPAAVVVVPAPVEVRTAPAPPRAPAAPRAAAAPPMAPAPPPLQPPRSSRPSQSSQSSQSSQVPASAASPPSPPSTAWSRSPTGAGAGVSPAVVTLPVPASVPGPVAAMSMSPRPPGAPASSTGASASPTGAPASPSSPASAPMTAPTAFPDGYQPPSAVLAAQLGAGVFLQLGAFNSLENAESAHARVSQQLPWLGVPVHIVLENDLFKLRAGPYRGRAQALAAAERVVRVTGARPFTVVR